MRRPSQISVVIPTYNRRESLANTLGALAAQRGVPDAFEVIVSIDGSQDGTSEYVASLCAPYRLSHVWHPNAGRATACNRGARQASGEILLFLDDDMEPDPDCLSAHLAAHEGSTRKAVTGPIPFSNEALTTPLVEFLKDKTDVVLSRLVQPDYERGVRDFFSSNFSIARDLFLDLEGFDENFRLYGNEDVELACRLSQAGVPIIFDPRPIARQHYSKDFRGLAWDNIEKGRTVILLAMKHPEVVGQLKLSEYYKCSRKWRYARAALLVLSRAFPHVPVSVCRCITYLECYRPTSIARLYSFALDYCFWLGVRQELKANHDAVASLSMSMSRVGTR